MFLETIQIVHGRARHLDDHRRRMVATGAHHGFTPPPLPPLDDLVPAELRRGRVRCRLVYRDAITGLDFMPYLPRTITTLRLVSADDLDYPFKVLDRTGLDCLRDRVEGADEVLIVKHGRLTDTTFTSVVLQRGEHLVTPDTPLLEGTARQRLLRLGSIVQAPLTPDDVGDFERIHLVNAMLELGELALPASAITW